MVEDEEKRGCRAAGRREREATMITRRGRRRRQWKDCSTGTDGSFLNITGYLSEAEPSRIEWTYEQHLSLLLKSVC